jgi:2,4-dienoyl-CoA reductase-like NADH-dependent reductase (Old Yellow Enzyme family)
MSDRLTAPNASPEPDAGGAALFPTLFSPLALGPITLKNRIVNSAHATGFALAGRYTERLRAYHRARARGGAAVLVSQATSVTADYLDLNAASDAIVEDYMSLLDDIHRFDCRYFVELNHPGRQSVYTGSGAQLYVAPSPMPVRSHGWDWRVPHELSETEIWDIISLFRAAARRCRLGGVDGIELHFAHGNLPEQFMSPATNRRKDRWGGPLADRLRFSFEVARAVREEVGQELVVGCRMTGGSRDSSPLEQSELLEIMGAVDAWGILDYISVSFGHYSDLRNTALNIPNLQFEPGLGRSEGKLIRGVVKQPVFLVGRINHPEIAEELLQEGACDAVVMARALIADADLPRKAREGRSGRIRPCVGAMNCYDRYGKGRGVSCIYNPVAGREEWWTDDPPPTSHPKHVLVIGAGPGGLECARVLAERGHYVTVQEREDEPGGLVRYATRVVERRELGIIITWLYDRCIEAGVTFGFGVTVTAAAVSASTVDCVVVASGSRLRQKSDVNRHGIEILSVYDIFRGTKRRHGHVLVVDDASDWVGFSAAYLLARTATAVTYVTSAVYPGLDFDLPSWSEFYRVLGDLGVTFRSLARVDSIKSDAVLIRDVVAGQVASIEGVTAMVQIEPRTAVDDLYRRSVSLESAAAMYLIGDAVAPRGIEEAVYEGHATARLI